MFPDTECLNDEIIKGDKYRSIKLLGFDNIPCKNACQWLIDQNEDENKDGASISVSQVVEQIYTNLESNWDVHE